ncbi:preprotein translocase subunit SecY [Candidatus Woesebacteria bacterium]|nr:preprotein translocase subunit SecY [Candidatus Woesebacteria bacterium]
MNRITALVRTVFKTPSLRNKLLFTAAIFFIFRLLAHIPLPSVDITQLRNLLGSSQFLSLLNVFSGGTLSNFSVVAVGINPYITATIVIQLASMVIPSLKEMQKDGESGRERVNQYARLLSVPLAVGQSISVLVLLRSQGLLLTSDPLSLITMIVSLVAGALILTWLGELVSQYGLGNGISMILLGGILSQLPQAVSQLAVVSSSDQLLVLSAFAVLFLFIIAAVVFMNEAVRKVSIQYAQRLRGSRVYGGQQTHLPIKVNVAGVMPIIFAVSIMLIPSFLARLLSATKVDSLIKLGQEMTALFAQTSMVYIVSYFVVVFAFTFFSALIFFNAEDISTELKKSGAFLPGIRPGSATKRFLEYVVMRVTVAGAVFLSLIAVMPSLAQRFTDIGSLAVSGTSVLIVVSVILETAKQIEGMLVEQNYDRYL